MQLRRILPGTRRYLCYIAASTTNEEQQLRVSLKALQENSLADPATYAQLLKQCGHLGALEEGKFLHRHIAASGLENNCFLGNLLVHMYGRCGCLAEAEHVFKSISERNVFSWSIMLSAFAQNGHFSGALKVYRRLHLEGVEPCKAIYVAMLIACAAAGQLGHGCAVHLHVASIGWELDVQVATSIVNMYGKCGSLDRARLVFERMQYRDAVCWNTIMSLHARSGESLEALALYFEMNLEGTRANRNTFATLVEACAISGSLSFGQQVHEHVLESGFGLDLVITNCLVNMYSKCGCLEDARLLFDGLDYKNRVSWNVMISGYSHNGFGQFALATARRMWLEGEQPDKFTFLCMVDVCHSPQALELVHTMRNSMVATDDDMLVGTSLVKAYAKFGLLEAARTAFEAIRVRDIVCWNAMLAGYSQNGRASEAVEMLHFMDQLGVKLNKSSYTSILETCSLKQGRMLHHRITAAGYDFDMQVGTTLVNMYARCRQLEDARSVFDKMQAKDVPAWTSMIASAMDNGYPTAALGLFYNMELEGLKSNKVTLACVVDACTCMLDLGLGEQIHNRIHCCGWDADNVLANSLVHMYSKFRMPGKAWSVFEQLRDRDVISWNAVISAAVASSMLVYHCMIQDGTKPDAISFLGVLEACSSQGGEGLVESVRLVHSHITESGFAGVGMVGTTLIDMYGKAGLISDAESVFKGLEDKTDVISWNAMAAVYTAGGNAWSALGLLRNMDIDGVKVDKVTLGVMLQAVELLADMQILARLHERVLSAGLESEVSVGSTLVSVYGGTFANLFAAQEAFNNIRGRKKIVAWNGMLLALARHGHLPQMLVLLQDMSLDGVKPNDATLTSFLFACNHSGLLVEAARCFSYMISDHDIVPTAAHYTSLVGLLGRAGWTSEAVELIASMPFSASAYEWMALLSLMEHDEELGQRAAQRVAELEPNSGAPYVSFSNQLVASIS